MQADARRIGRHLDVMCTEIGNRLCGEPGEQAGADYIEGQLKRIGLDARQEPFRFPNWRLKRSGLWVGKAKPAKPLAHGEFMYSASTTAKGVSGPIVYLQGGHEHDLAGKNLKGKIGLLIGSLAMQEEEVKQRFVHSGLAGLIAVDNRIPFDWVSSCGMAPQWIGGFSLPAVALPFMTAIDLVKQLPMRARIRVDGRHQLDQSQNVIGELTGSRWPEQVIVVSAHHDSVPGNVGANDNASGCAFVMEMARLLASRRPKRTVRFVTYGVEERLSVGAYVHMRRLGRRAKDVVFCLNADSIGAMVGEDTARITGPPALARLVESHYRKRQHPVCTTVGTSVYSDHFPLNVTGAPSVWLSRPNMTGGYYWTLHTEKDCRENVSADVIARSATTAASLIRKIADAPRMPFPRTLPPAIAKEVREGARRAYRHPWPVRVEDGLPTLMPPSA